MHPAYLYVVSQRYAGGVSADTSPAPISDQISAKRSRVRARRLRRRLSRRSLAGAAPAIESRVAVVPTAARELLRNP